MKRRLITTLLLLITSHALQAQIRFLPKFIRRMYFTKDSSKKPSFVLLPVLSSAPETGVELGGAALFSFYTDTMKQTRVSNVFGYATLTTKGQNRLSLSTNYWTPGNGYHYSAGVSYINFPFDFYGIGNNTRKADADHIGEKRYKFNFAGEKLLAKNIYAGYVLGAYKYNYHDDDRGGIFDTEPQVQDRSGGSGIFAGPSLIYDSRNNNTYTTSGLFITTYFNAIHGVFGNNDYKGGLFNIEYSQFFLLQKKLVLGLDVQEQSLTGSRSPFYLLPELGSDELMRGYYGGRYRDRNYIAGQAELRYRVSDRFGLVGFLGTGEVFHSSFSLPQLKPNYGGGVRYFFDVEKGLSVRIDYGVGEKPTSEKRESGVYIGLGQAF